ncbi:MAG: tRNA pseudouridine(55) synthase TruB [Planctomycetota bacterium]|nr:tRNA pseudouridine(55) synthase TruB [Planctomycetota bacterium]
MNRDKEEQRLRINGLLIVNKPPIISSMGIVSRVRGRARGARTGHAGTLDPLATGVLVMGLGRATKRLDSLMALEKQYRTTIDLSITNASFDLELDADPVEISSPPDRMAVEAALENFIGTCMQAPPIYSAIKRDGTKSYERARKDPTDHFELEPRPVELHELLLLDYTWPLVDLSIRCGKGFYVRSLARDLGLALGTGGVCTSIHRNAIGPFTDEMAVDFDDIPDPLEQEHLLEWPRT